MNVFVKQENLIFKEKSMNERKSSKILFAKPFFFYVVSIFIARAADTTLN